MSYPCRTHRRVRTPIAGRDDAARTLLLATDRGAYECAVVACVDASRLPLTMFIFDGRSDLDDALELGVEAVIAAAASADSPLAAIFLGSSRTSGELGPSPTDERRWVRMAERCADAGVELLDWLLIREGTVCSVAEGLEPGPCW